MVTHQDLLLFGGLLILGLVLVGVISLFAFQKVPSADSLARKFRLQPADSTAGDVFFLRGERDGYRVSLRQHRSPFDDYWTSWELELPESSGLWLSLMRRSWSEGLADTLVREAGGPSGCLEVTTLELDFDEDFCVISDAPESVLALLSREIRDLLAITPELATVVVTRDTVRVSSTGLPRTNELKELFELATTFARRLSELERDSTESG